MDNEQNTNQPVVAQPPVETLPPAQSPEVGGPAPVVSSGGPKKPNLIGIIIAVVIGLLLLGGAAYALTKDKDNKKADNSSNNSSEKKEESNKKANNAVTADSQSDFAAVCTNGSVKNAAVYDADSKPHKVVAFSQRPGRTNFSTESAGYGTEYYVDSDTDLSTVSVVACLQVVEGSEAKALVCDYEKDGATVNVDLYSARYSLAFYSAQSGDKIGDGEEINAPATRCPMFLAYDAATMSAQASIDDKALEAEIAKFAL